MTVHLERVFQGSRRFEGRYIGVYDGYLAVQIDNQRYAFPLTDIRCWIIST